MGLLNKGSRSIGIAAFFLVLTSAAAFAAAGVTVKSFGSHGVAVVPDRQSHVINRPADLLRDGHGRILVVGSRDVLFRRASTGLPALYRSSMSISRLKPDGSIDRTFGNKGTAIVSYKRLRNANGLAAAVQSNGKIILAGLADRTPVNSDRDSVEHPMIARLRSNGKIDRTFGSNGYVVLNSRGKFVGEVFAGVVVRSSGKVVVASDDNGSYLAVTQLKSSGKLDRAFGKNGVRRVTPIGADGRVTGGAPTAIALAKNGSIVELGSSKFDSTPVNSDIQECIAIRFTRSGALDRSFGNDGFFKASSVLAKSTTSDCTSLAIDSHGRPVLGGRTGAVAFSGTGELIPIRYAPTAIRLTLSGSVDTSFGSGGIGIASYSARSLAIDSIALLPSGGPVLCGFADDSMTGNSDPYFAAFKGSGAYDATLSSVLAKSLRVDESKVDLFACARSSNRLLVTGQDAAGSTVRSAVQALTAR
ncbi:MAG: hypothetical protein ACRDKI_10350 [Solirubrobacterales bacterium]